MVKANRSVSSLMDSHIKLSYKFGDMIDHSPFICYKNSLNAYQLNYEYIYRRQKLLLSDISMGRGSYITCCLQVFVLPP